MLEQWLAVAVEEAGVADLDPALLSEPAITVILDLARRAAHEVERPAAPLAAFAAGLALGRSDGGLAELEDLAARMGERAESFEQAESFEDGE